MKNSKIIKALSLILILSLAFGSGNIARYSYTAAENAEAAQLNIGYLPAAVTDWSGRPSGDGAFGEMPRSYKTAFSGTERDTARPRISEEGEGANGSYALKIGAAGIAADDYEITLDFPGKGVLSRKKEYTVSLWLKKSAGTAGEVRLGFREADKTEYKLTVSDSYLTNDWKEFSFVYKTGTQCAQNICRIAVAYSSVGGAELLIDNITVKRTDLSSDEEYFKAGSFDTVYYTGGDAPSPDPELSYLPYGIERFSPVSNYIKADPKFALMNNHNAAVAEGEGVNGSCALRLGAGKINSYMLLGSAVSALKNGKEYLLSFRIRKESKISFFKIGYATNWTDYTLFELSDDTVSESYKYYGVKFLTKDNCEGSWNHLILSFEAPEGGAVYLDDISLTDLNGENELFTKGSFDFPYYAGEAGDTPVDGMLYQPYSLNDYAPIRNYITGMGEKTSLVNNPGAAIREGGGLSGSCALELSGGEKIKSYICIGSGTGSLSDETEYMLAVRIKKSGKIDNLTLGYTANYKDYTLIELSDSAVKAEYKYYGIRFKTENNCKGTWQHLWLSFEAGNGDNKAFIDGIELYPAADDTKYNIFAQGSFDFPFRRESFDTAPDGEYAAKLLSAYTEKQYFFGFDKTDNANAANLSVTENEGVKGSAALEIRGDGNKHTLMFVLGGLSSLKGGGKYRLGFKVRAKYGETADFTRSLAAGITEQWVQHTALKFHGENLTDRIAEDYAYYTVDLTASAECAGAWSYIFFNYCFAEGDRLYIDDIELYAYDSGNAWILDTEGKPMNVYPNGSFDMKNLGQSAANFTDNACGQASTFGAYYNKDFESGNNIAEIAAVSDAPSGSYCLKIGFSDKAVNGEFMNWLIPTRPGCSYKITAYVKCVGDIKNAQVGVVDGKWGEHYYPIPLNSYQHGKWTKIEFIYNDLTTTYELQTYRYLKIRFASDNGGGMLLDNFSCVQTGVPEERAVNAAGYDDGRFEKPDSYPQVEWNNDRYISKKGKR